MNKYTIIAAVHTYGSITQVVPKEKVREECERLKKVLSVGEAPKYIQIEVVNNETGEIREFWNNADNKINF